MACTPSPPPSASSSPASPSRRTATCGGCERAVEQASVGALSGAVGTYAANGPEVEAARARAAGARARGRLHAGGAARPPRRAAVGHRARGRGARALRHRDPPPAAHRGARGRGAVPRRARRARRRCRTSATRSCASASPASRGCCAATRRPALENVALWHERDISHSSVERVTLPDATILLDYAQHLAIARGGRDDGPRRPHARQPRAHPRRAVLASARCWRWWRPGIRATTPTGSSRRTPSAPGTRASSSASCSPRPRRGLDLDTIFDPAAFVRHADEIVGRLDAIGEFEGPAEPSCSRHPSASHERPTPHPEATIAVLPTYADNNPTS